VLLDDLVSQALLLEVERYRLFLFLLLDLTSGSHRHLGLEDISQLGRARILTQLPHVPV